MTRNKRPMLIIIAAVLAGGAALTAFDYVSSNNRHEPSAPPRAVIVAARAINARETITGAMLQTAMRPADAVDPGSYSSDAALEGDISLADIPAGAALTSSNVTRAANLPSAVHLSNGMRAMSIAVDEVKDVSGLLQPGDHVDVYAITSRSATEQPQAFAILRNIIVLGVGGQVTEVAAGATPGPQTMQWRSVTLQVGATQAKTLAVADLNSTIRLALRPPGESTRSERTDAFSVPMQTGPSLPSAPAPAAPVAASMPAPAKGGAQADPPRRVPNDGVQYILGDHIEGSGTQ